MREAFELWAHPQLGEIYAVRRVADAVTGVCGPIPLAAIPMLDLSRCFYAGRGPAARWAETRRSWAPWSAGGAPRLTQARGARR